VLVRAALAVVIAAGLAAPPASAQFFIPIPRKAKPAEAGPPKDLPKWEADVWPYPAPDPKAWWTDKRPKVEEAADPLGGRRIGRGERLPAVDNGLDASTYRLWGLMPLQWQVVRPGEMIVEVWVRPSNSVRQSVVRAIVKGDEAFVQGRAGLACCEAGISRRMGFDAKLPPGWADRLAALSKHPAWTSPRDVLVDEAGSAEALCVEGTSYDLTLVIPGGRSWTLRRACDPAEIGEAADILEAVLGAAMGQDPRFDVIFPGGANFTTARNAYRSLVANGGRLTRDPQARAEAPRIEPRPVPEADASAVAPEPPATPRSGQAESPDR